MRPVRLSLLVAALIARPSICAARSQAYLHTAPSNPVSVVTPQTEWEITTDQTTGQVTVHKWLLRDIDGNVAFAIKPFSVDLDVSATDRHIFEGDTPYGPLTLNPIGTLSRSPDEYRLWLHFDPQPVVDAPMLPNVQPWKLIWFLVQVPEPATASMLVMGVVGLFHRHRLPIPSGQNRPISAT